MTTRKKQDEKQEDDVQKVSIEDVGPKAKDVHEQAVKASIFSEKVFLSFFAAIVACATCWQAYLQYRTNLAVETGNKAQATSDIQAAQKVEVVKETLDSTTRQTEEKLRSLEKVTKETHKLVNSGSLVTLKLLAEVSRWKATQTNDPDHIKAAELAEKNVRDHEAKQKALDEAKDK